MTYIKSWWKKINGNEGMELRTKVKPLATIAISLIVVTVAFVIGHFVLPFKIPFFTYTSEVEVSPTLDITRETVFTGTLRSTSGGKYYLFTQNSEAITLEAP